MELRILPRLLYHPAEAGDFLFKERKKLMYFYEDDPLRDMERMMRGIPNFLPRGHGVMILCRHEYSARNRDCRNCPCHTDRGKGSGYGLAACAALKEGMEAGAATVREILTETMSGIRYPPFMKRLEQYIKESERTPMDFRNEKHRMAFREAAAKLDKKNHALMAALYLLTADHRLWLAAGQSVRRNKISFDRIRLKNSTENGYALYCAAKDLYLGTKNLTVRDLADTGLIPPKLFGIICNGMAVRRFGLGAVKFNTERNGCG